MAEEVIKRDSNHKVIGAGVTDDAAQEIRMLRVNPMTDYILVAFAGSGPAGPSTGKRPAKRDQNHKPMALGWNEDTQQVQEILTDEDGYIICKMV